MKEAILLVIFILFTSLSIDAQVGVGTTTPDASSALDISATDKGILIPRVSLGDVTSTMLDGTNTAASGLLIYNTNASVSGGSGVGYYYFNGTIWERLVTTSTASDDADWYEEGTTSAPNDINDEIYTLGNVAIGKNNATYPLDVEATSGIRAISARISGADNTTAYGIYSQNSNTGSGNHHGSYNLVDGVGTGAHYGVSNFLNGSNSSAKYGVRNTLSSSGTKYGIWNDIQNSTNNLVAGVHNEINSSGTGLVRGFYNDMTDTNSGFLLGLQNQLSGTGSGDHFGVSNSLTGSGGGRKVGSYNFVNPSAGGTHYGVLSNVLKPASFAGFFVGDVAIGTNNPFGTGTPDHYIFPASRGTNAQVMQTDGSGNISWVDPSTLDDEDWVIDTTGSTILYPTNTTDNVAIGKTTANAKLDVENDTSGIAGSFTQLGSTGNSGNITNTVLGTTGNITGISNNLLVDGTGDKTGIHNNIDFGTVGATGLKKGVFNEIESANGDTMGVNNVLTGISAGFQYGSYNSISVSGNGSHYGTLNQLIGTGAGNQFGTLNQMRNTGSTAQFATYNSFSNSSTGDQTGVRNDMLSTANSEHKGMYTQFTGSGAGPQIGVENRLAGTGNGTKTGVYNNIIDSGNGIHYGVRNSLSGSGTGVKYGLYNFINNTAGGTHYGVYSSVLKTNSFAGYFQGAVAIGTNGSNTYTFPASRGTANQIIQTDGAGNLSWVDPINEDKAIVRLGRSSNLGGMTTNSETALIMNTAIFNLGGGLHNTSTGAYTIPYSGVYNIIANLNFSFSSASSNNAVCLFRVYVNGSYYDQIYNQKEAATSASWGINYNYNIHLSLNAGDVVTFRILPVFSGPSSPQITSNATNVVIKKEY
ncbi:beta strand repeat-containing protein [Constantimarinum furrinae]|uniref:C1q domain-containing protein n=1 Tax=Constantimarinum furrinae TaxID=2562285 RepID=A0A7G8PXH8_9FLAO|nr:hypothetical protein [Constantimarinum furrinae]QNJ99044.1 hypothetical protein ALE3EI_2508 [Constantimarinum furrinae]